MPSAPIEPMLVELSRWLSRALQYSASHPSCVALATQTQALAQAALNVEPTIQLGVLKDELMLGDEAIAHRAVRGRLAPYLHERGVLVLRFARGVTVLELTSFIEVITLGAPAIFDAGGLAHLLAAKGVSRVQIEEISHDITNEEREEHRRRKKFRSFFADMLRNLLANRGDIASLADQVEELLEHPDIAVAVLEERSAAGLAEAVAGMALMARQSEARTGTDLRAKFCFVLRSLSPASRVSVLRGFPALVGEFRQALLWAAEGFTEEELGHFLFPSVRTRHAELEDVLYGARALVVSNARRLVAMRSVARMLSDLAMDEPETAEVLGDLSRAPQEFESCRNERAYLAEAAQRLMAVRTVAVSAFERTTSTPPPREDGFTGGRLATAEVVKLAAARPDFDRFSTRLPVAATALAEAGSVDAAIGILDALRAVGPEQRVPAEQALKKVAQSPAVPAILRELDRASLTAEAEALEELVLTVKILLRNPAPVLERLVSSENRKMRRILLDALPLAGPALLPLLRAKMKSDRWYVTRNVVTLLPRCGGTTADLQLVARHSHERVRVEVVRAIRAMPGDKTAMDILAGYVTDTSQEVQKTALASLKGELLGTDAIATLERLAGDDKQPEELRRRLVRALGECPDGSAARALFNLLQPRGLIEIGSAGAVRDIAAAALRASPAPEAAKLFADGLKSDVRRVRKACERAAGAGS